LNALLFKLTLVSTLTAEIAAMPQLSQIFVYPIKSLDRVSVTSAQVLPSGALRYDRQWAMVDVNGEFVNGKRTPLVHSLRAAVDLETQTVRFGLRQGPLLSPAWHLAGDLPQIQAWLSDHFGQAVQLVKNEEQGFPDDTASPGPTVISQATIAEVASWYEGISSAEMDLRLRTTLVLEGAEPFWEDRLYGPAPKADPVAFRIGAVQFLGVNPCLRCVVPTRDPETGVVHRGFQGKFLQRRAETLPSWAAASRFKPYYRLAVNTRLAPGSLGDRICVGDEITLESEA
jgi:uncharacterized protein